MTTTPTTELREMTAADQADVLGLLTTTMAGGPTGERTADYFAWKHHLNPFGASPGLVAVHGGRIVGARLFLRWNLAVNGQVLQAVRAVDTATHPDFQRQGIFRRLTMSLLEQLDAEEQIHLVFNTPNADSLPGYVRMGWQEVGRLPVRVSPVRPLAFLRGARGASAANASGSAGAATKVTAVTRHSSLASASAALGPTDAVRSLVAQAEDRDRLHTPLSVDYLRWRYAEAPGLDYRGLQVWRNDELVGLGFGRLRPRAGLVELTLGDVIVRQGDRAAAESVLGAARRSGVDHVVVHTAPGTEIAARALRSGYVQAPGRGIRLLANPRRSCPVDVCDPGAWRLSLGDLELF